MKKKLSADLKHLEDALGQYWIYIISSCSFLIIGIWMLISPEKPDHNSIEKGSVYLVKEMWGTPLGIVIVSIMVLILAYVFYRKSILKGLTWIRWSNGYYLFDKQERISGLSGLFDYKDLLVFYPAKKQVVRLKNYTHCKLQRYMKAVVDRDFEWDAPYWSASDEGYVLIYQGVSVANSTSEKRGEDLLVKAPDHHKTFLFANYYNSKDDKIRKAQFA